MPDAPRERRGKPLTLRGLMRHRYEVQVRTSYGWSSAGNWPARTKVEGLKSLEQCASPWANGYVPNQDYRLVRLVPEVLAVRRAKKVTR